MISDAETDSIKTMKLAKWVTSLPNLNIILGGLFETKTVSGEKTLILISLKKKKRSNIRKTIMNENVQPTNNNFNNVKWNIPVWNERWWWSEENIVEINWKRDLRKR